MRKLSLRQISSFFFRKPSALLQEINMNAELIAWHNAHPPKVILDSRRSLYEHVNAELGDNVSIDYLEFGVYEGESMQTWLDINESMQSRFYGFDTFDGLPEEWSHVTRTFDRGHFDAGGVAPEINDNRVSFIKGLFQETLKDFIKSFAVKNPLIIHNDSDLYTSTLYCLTQLDMLLIEGSVIIFDEFNIATHEFCAFRDYVNSYRRDFVVLGVVGDLPYGQVAVQMR